MRGEDEESGGRAVIAKGDERERETDRRKDAPGGGDALSISR